MDALLAVEKEQGVDMRLSMCNRATNRENVQVEDVLSQSTVQPNNVQYEPVIQQILPFPPLNPVQQLVQSQVQQPGVQP